MWGRRPRRCRVRRRRSRSETRSVRRPEQLTHAETGEHRHREVGQPSPRPQERNTLAPGTTSYASRLRTASIRPFRTARPPSSYATNACTNRLRRCTDRADDRSCEDRDAQIVADLLLQIPTGPRRREHRSTARTAEQVRKAEQEEVMRRYGVLERTRHRQFGSDTRTTERHQRGATGSHRCRHRTRSRRQSDP